MEYFAFQWHITEACDQRCRHCYIYALGSHARFQEMALEDMLTVIRNCQTFCEKAGRLPYFYITGGDPILHPQFWTLLEILRIADIPFTIMGNPFHLNDEVCRRLKEYGCEKYQLSLDGMRQTHDWFRKPGSFDITLEKIGCINQAGIRSVVMTTVSGANIGQVPEIIDAVVQAGANVFAFARYCPTSEEKDVGIAPQRYRQLLEAAQNDKAGRLSQVGAEMDFAAQRKEDCALLMDLLREGKLPLRVTHNDTKINNVLFDDETDRAIVVIDLDTVMPGLVGHDFGDAIRFAANYVEEDSPETERAGVNMAVFRAFTEGFLKQTASTLTEREIDTLALSCFALACELATRFLGDYLLGDPYFKIDYPEHNLVRTRCQIALARDMLEKLPEMEEMVRSCAEKYRGTGAADRQLLYSSVAK